MEENVRKELETLKGMVLNWKKDYLGWAPPDGGWEYLPQELMEEIETHISPYIRRMYECGYLNPSEIREFMESCYMQVEDLRDTLGEMEAKRLSAKGG
ncbi:MAG: hypothetical protein HY896_00940 [Deltaproteobacteria bacterium]|nr:hypothetical protein [Deltaproteobacteria bacterium]